MNVCTTRYTQAQIEAIKENPNKSYISLSVKDKFGDSGLTGVAIVSYADGKGKIDDFLMSCRLMGRNIEFSFVDYMMSFLKEHGCRTVESQYIPTQKNKPVSYFFEKCGFPVVFEKEGEKKYALAISDYNIKNIDYIKVN